MVVGGCNHVQQAFDVILQDEEDGDLEEDIVQEKSNSP